MRSRELRDTSTTKQKQNAWNSVESYAFTRYVVPAEAFASNARLNLGFCREYEEGAADWDECVKQVGFRGFV